MSEESIQFISYEQANEIVGNIVEEEHLHEANRRILTVYDKNGRELCWYDAEEMLEEVQAENPGLKGDDLKKEVVRVIMHQIPEWAAQKMEDREDDEVPAPCGCGCKR